MTPKKPTSERLAKNLKLRELQFRGLRRTQLSTLSFSHKNDQRKKIDTLGDYDNKTPTHMAVTHPISKNSAKFSKSNSQGIGPKIGYAQNQQDSLNHFQFFRNKKSLTQKSYLDS